MTESFTLGGDPAAIRASAQRWSSFGGSATSASSDLKGLDSGEFVGDEGETYRTRINSDMQPHLDTTGGAWASIAGALQKFAGELEDLQQRMDSLRTQAGHQQKAVDAAAASLTSAKSADATHTQQQQEATKALKPGETLPPSTYTSPSGSASTSLSSARSDLNNTVAEARKVRDDHDKAVKACCGTIDDAKGRRFQKPPGFWDKVKSVASSAWDAAKAGVSWAAKHVGPLLKMVSMVAGMLALIPGLGPIMGPIALVAGGVALALDVMNKLMNGEGSWAQMGLDALGLVPGVKQVSMMGKMTKLGNAAKNIEKASDGVKGAEAALVAAKNAKPPLALLTRNGRAAKAAVKNAKTDVTEAKTALKSANSQYKAIDDYYKNVDKVWRRIDLGTTATTAGLTGVRNYEVNGSLKEALLAGSVSATGIKIPAAGKKFNAIQGIVSNGAATGHQALNMYVLHPELAGDGVQQVKLLTSGGKTILSGSNTVRFSSEGTHPNGTPRAAFEVPNHWK